MTIKLTKVSVVNSMPKLFVITLNFKLIEGTAELLSRDFSENYRTGQDVSEIVGRFRKKMQNTIDVYKSEQILFLHTQLDSAIATLENNLTV